jgi:erythromycin esterase-like protein
MAQRQHATTPADRVTSRAEPFTDEATRYDHLLDLIGDARLVLIGEESHGTHEYYRERAAITRRLIEEKHFHAVAAEADWPDAFRVNRYVRNTSNDQSADDALGDFRRFPHWMW